jgi:ABC-type transport system substrate-binding protein
MVFERNPNYWREGEPYLDTLITRPLDGSQQSADALTTGTADLAYITFLDTAARLDDTGFGSSGTSRPQGYGASFNFSRAPFDDARVRKALVLALDCEDVNMKATNGEGERACGKGTAYFPEDHPFHDPSVTQPANNLAEAQKLIDAYVAAKGPIDFSLATPDALAPVGTAVAQGWSRLKGVNVRLELMTGGQAVTQFNQGNFQARISGAGGWEYVDEADAVLRAGASLNVQRYSNPKVDAILDEGFGATDPDDRKKYLNDIGKLLFEDAFFVRIYFVSYQTYFADHVRGVDSVHLEYRNPMPSTLWTTKR